MSLARHLETVVLLLLLSLLIGCGKGTVDSERDPVYFSPLEDHELEPKIHEDPGPAMSAEERQQIQPVIEGFRQNARRVLVKPDIGQRISQIESIFIASGHIFELADIYQGLVEEEGVSSPAAPRLAWILLQLGQEKQARMWIDRLLVEYPGRASSWYLDAIYHLPRLRESNAAAARIVYSWNRSQSEDTTSLAGFGQRQMTMVGQQVAQLEERLSKAALDRAEKDLAELLATPISELETPPGLKDEAAEAAPEEDLVDDEQQGQVDEGARSDDSPTEQQEQNTDNAQGSPDDTRQPAPPANRSEEKTEPVKITVARGTIALANDDTEKAMQMFQAALQREPDNVEAKLGMARAGWTVEEMKNQSASVIRQLAARDDLTPRQTYEIGLFAFSKMDDNALATKLWEQVADDDPELAKRVGLNELLEKARR
ncbi:MAG: tetratricopeptide repeat protein [Myxococcota bacterium]